MPYKQIRFRNILYCTCLADIPYLKLWICCKSLLFISCIQCLTSKILTHRLKWILESFQVFPTLPKGSFAIWILFRGSFDGYFLRSMICSTYYTALVLMETTPLCEILAWVESNDPERKHFFHTYYHGIRFGKICIFLLCIYT